MNSKEEQYKSLLAQLASLIEGEREEVSVLSNASALLREVMGDRYFWVGFYLVRDGKLVLGPFQGTVACYRIALGRGVCGTAWQQRATLVVPDVEQFAGHIACSSLSRSEIVVPLADGDGVVTAGDARSLLRRSVGLADETAVEPPAAGEVTAAFSRRMASS